MTTGNYSVAEGAYLSAKNGYTHIAGISAITTAQRQFVWNPGGTAGFYEPKNLTGTFNINPYGGISGVYIGDRSLDEIIGTESQSGLSTKVDISSLMNVVSLGSPGQVQTSSGIAIGYGNHIQQGSVGDNVSSFAIGLENKIFRKYSCAIGNSNQLSNTYTIAIGRLLSVDNNGSMAMGIRAKTNETY